MAAVLVMSTAGARVVALAPPVAAGAQAFAVLRANLETQSAVVAQMASATSRARLAALLSEDSRLVDSDLALLNQMSGGAGVGIPPQTSPFPMGPAQGSTGVPPAPAGTPSGPPTQNPFPFP